VRSILKGAVAVAALSFAPLGFALAAETPPAAAPLPVATLDGLVGALNAAIKQSVSLMQADQERVRTIAALERALAAADRQLASKQSALADSRARQEAVLAALERLAANRPEGVLLAAQRPLDRIRGAMLMASTVPALSAEAQALVNDLQRLATLRTQIETKQAALAHDRQGLVRGRSQVVQLVAKREALRHQILREEAEGDPRAVKLGAVAVDLSDLIKRADALAVERDRERQQRAAKAKGTPTIDPTRPPGLRDFDGHAALVAPVAGRIERRFGQADNTGATSQGVTLRASADTDVVAPFDGRIDYAGPFRAYPLILIIGHGGGYASVLTGMARVDAKVGEWVVAGEPIGVMAEPGNEGATIYIEMRHDGRPVDPQLSLADRSEQEVGHKVTE
jgi:murein hydrolase activator